MFRFKSEHCNEGGNHIFSFFSDLSGTAQIKLILAIAVIVFICLKTRLSFSYLRILLVMLLWPIGLLAGFVVADSDGLDIATRRSVMLTAIALLFASGIVVSISALIGDKKRSAKQRLFLKWVSIISWLPVGLIPGIIGFGWKYLLCVTILPSITIHQLFQWQKKIAENKEMMSGK